MCRVLWNISIVCLHAASVTCLFSHEQGWRTNTAIRKLFTDLHYKLKEIRRVTPLSVLSLALTFNNIAKNNFCEYNYEHLMSLPTTGDEMRCLWLQLFRFASWRSALQHFPVNGFGDTLLPRHECVDTDVKSREHSTKLFQILQL